MTGGLFCCRPPGESGDQRVSRHESRENRLIQDAYNLEMCAED
jgi:hypothetical protein